MVRSVENRAFCNTANSELCEVVCPLKKEKKEKKMLHYKNFVVGDEMKSSSVK